MKPLTCLALIVMGRLSTVLEPSLVMATADSSLWQRQPEQPEAILGPVVYTEEPVKMLNYQITQFLLKWSFIDYKQNVVLPLNGVAHFRSHKLIEAWVLMQSFRPEMGHWYLDIRLHNTQQRGVIGSFSTRASVMAWALNATSSLTVSKAKVPRDSWFNVFEG